MGLFSTVINQCPVLGEEFMGELQTKDFECLMDTYWLSPSGRLFKIEWAGAYEFEENPESTRWYDKFQWKKTGKHGKLKPYRRSVVARFYPACGAGDWKEIHVFFQGGVLKSVLPIDEVYDDSGQWRLDDPDR